MNKTHWENYVKAIPVANEKEDPVKRLFSIVGDRNLANVIYFHLGNSAINWLDSPVPALGNKKPKDFLTSEAGLDSLKDMLMKMPC